MNWIVFAAISVIGGSVGNIIRRRLMGQDTSDPMIVAVLVQLIAGIFTACYAFAKGFESAPIIEYWPNYLLMIMGWSIATYCTYVVYKYIEAGEATLLASFSSVISILGGVFILHEQFDIQSLMGVLLILSAVVIIALDSMKHFEINKGFFYALLSGLFAGIAIINDTYMLRDGEGVSQLSLAFFLPGLALFAVQFKKVAFTLHHHSRNFWGQIILQSAFSFFSAGAYYTALDMGAPASQLSPIGQSSIILTVILGMIFLGERRHMAKKFMCAVLVFCGVFLLSK